MAENCHLRISLGAVQHTCEQYSNAMSSDRDLVKETLDNAASATEMGMEVNERTYGEEIWLSTECYPERIPLAVRQRTHRHYHLDTAVCEEEIFFRDRAQQNVNSLSRASKRSKCSVWLDCNTRKWIKVNALA